MIHPLPFETDGTYKRFFHTDYLGSIRRISTGNSSSDFWGRDYYPFGAERAAWGLDNDYKFTGKERDDDIALDYSWHRYYDYELGRFTQVDPLWQKYPGLSPYHYCSNNPLTRVDPDGLAVVAVKNEKLSNSPLLFASMTYSLTPSSAAGGLGLLGLSLLANSISKPSPTPEIKLQQIKNKVKKTTPMPTPGNNGDYNYNNNKPGNKISIGKKIAIAVMSALGVSNNYTAPHENPNSSNSSSNHSDSNQQSNSNKNKQSGDSKKNQTAQPVDINTPKE